MGFLQRFFHGRNGSDQLNFALMIAGVALSFLSRVMFQNLFQTLAWVALGLCLFRMVSRNIDKRRQENAQFLALVSRLRPQSPSTSWRRGPKKDGANFCYLKCPNCSQSMRVPKGKGNIKITCSNCGQVFYEKV